LSQKKSVVESDSSIISTRPRRRNPTKSGRIGMAAMALGIMKSGPPLKELTIDSCQVMLKHVEALKMENSLVLS